MSDHSERPDATRYTSQIAARYGYGVTDTHAVPQDEETATRNATIDNLLSRRSCRRYTDEPVSDALFGLLLACAQSAPTKSNLQQYSIIHIKDPAQRAALAPLCPKTPQLAGCPVLLIFCADLARNQRLTENRGYSFANAHMDGLINGVIDAAMAMQCFITAAESIGLGCAAISEIRDDIVAISDILGLPEGVMPIAGLTAGWPADPGYINQRLPAEIVLHRDRYDTADEADKIADYDRRRHAIFATPPARQLHTDRYGTCDYYPWSENLARQMSIRERDNLSGFLRRQGFALD
ncbi:MAG TPA: NADPH-dependent oxidoreductase [Alphaproteobacteria bacterium]|nr:NADPH-dependent oxidoreductase [Alphaproteobacteria bacterium]